MNYVVLSAREHIRHARICLPVQILTAPTEFDFNLNVHSFLFEIIAIRSGGNGLYQFFKSFNGNDIIHFDRRIHFFKNDHKRLLNTFATIIVTVNRFLNIFNVIIIICGLVIPGSSLIVIARAS